MRPRNEVAYLGYGQKETQQLKYNYCSLMKSSINLIEHDKQRDFKHTIFNVFVVKCFCEQNSSFQPMGSKGGMFCELDFKGTYNYDSMGMRFFSCMN